MGSQTNRHPGPESRFASILRHPGAILAFAFIGVGATTDTTAFKTVMDLVLPEEAAAVSWLLALGATSLALLTAWNIGIALRRRQRREPGCSRWWTGILVAGWLTLGVTLFVVRWNGPADTDGSDVSFHVGTHFGATSSANLDISTGAGPQTHITAIFFAAIYLVSGLCSIGEAERLYRPLYYLYLRRKRELERQEQVMATAVEAAAGAAARVEQCIAQFDLDDALRDAAIGHRQAFGTELANYARVVMAALMDDPAKTNVTDTGPQPFPGWAGPDCREVRPA